MADTDPALNWSDLDRKAVDTVRVLAMDAVEKSGNGHPGTAMSLAPAAYLLFNRVMRHDPTDPHWPGRDRFVLSAGHSSLTLYIQLFLSGYSLSLDDLKALRQWDSLTPGHPEFGHTPGVEVTTGPLGQGIGNAVGMAMATRRERGLFDPAGDPGQSPFDHNVYAICSDGDMEEGVSHESSAIAAVQKLGNLTVIYDDNEISIEDDTRIAKCEDVGARYAAYGWHVQHVDWRKGDPGKRDYQESAEALYDAILAAQQVTDKPSFIVLKTIIGWPAPNKQNTGKIHGSALGADEVAATKKVLGFDPSESFQVDPAVLQHTKLAVERGRKLHDEWQQRFDAWAQGNPDAKQLWDRLSRRALPVGWEESLPEFPADAKGIATRAASGKTLEALAPVLPELWGGSADLAESNNTTMKGEPSFIPPEYATKEFPGDEYGRTLHFGIREHGMGAILNGITAHGRTRPYGGTFLVFSDYMRGAVRLSALMKLPVIYVWTHDSIGLGEDGPTHQPIETLSALRAIVGLDVVRPADANETVWAWRGALEHTDRPTALALTRQNVPTDRPRPVRVRRGCPQGRLRPVRGGRRRPPGDPHRHRLRGAALPRRAGAARGRGHPDPGRVDALPGVVLPAVAVVPAGGPAAWGQGAGDRRGWHPDELGPHSWRCGRAGEHRALRRQRTRQDPLRAVRVHRGQRGGKGQRRPGKGRRHHRSHDRELREYAMTDRLAELSATGVAVWLDDLSRVRLTTGSLDKMRREQHVVGVTTNPTIFAKALSDADAYDEQLRDLVAQRVTVEESVRLMTARDVRAACDVMRPAYDASAGVDGRVSIEVDPRKAQRPGQHGGRGQDAVVAGRPGKPVHQDPGDPGEPARHHRDPGRGHQRQRHADLLAGALPRGDGRVHVRSRAGQGERPRPRQDGLGGVVLRLPGGHRGGQAARQDRQRRGQGAQGQGGHRQREAGLRGVRRGVRHPALAEAGRRRRPPAASAVGVHLDQEPGVPGHDLRRGAHRPRHGQHHAGVGDLRVRGPRRDPRRTPSPATTATPSR